MGKDSLGGKTFERCEMKTFEETLAFLATVEGGEEYADAVKGHVSKVNNEAKNLRDRLKISISASEKLKKLAEIHGIADDVEDFDSEIDKIKEKLSNAGKGESVKISQLEKRLNILEKEKAEAIAEARGQKVNTSLTTLLTEMKVLPTVLSGVRDVLSTRIKHRDNGESYFSGDDGAELSLQDGVKNYLSVNTGFVQNTQKGGGGTKDNGGSGAKSMNRSDWDKLPAREKASFINEGGALVE